MATPLHLLPGLVAGILARSGGSLSGSNVSTFSAKRLIVGNPKATPPPDRSTSIATPTTFPPCPRTRLIVSHTRPPLLTTSSTTRPFSPLEILHPRRPP